MFGDYSLGDLSSIFVMQGFAGLILFSVYVLMALGLAIIFGQMGVINMAHGEFMILGAYMTYLCSGFFQTHLPALFPAYFFVAMALAFLASGALGMLVEWALIRHLYKRPLDTLLATWGLSLILQQAYRTIFGAREVGVELPAWLIGSVQVTDTIEIPINGMFVMAITTLITVGVALLMYRSRFGAQVRAVVQNRADGRRRRHRHREGGPPHLRPRLRHRRHRRLGLHHGGLHGADLGPALHRRHLPDRGLRRRRLPARHHRLGLLDLADAVDPRILPLGLHREGDHAAGGGRHPDAAAAGPLHPQGPALRSLNVMTRSTSPTPVVNDNPFMKPMEWVSLALLVAVIFVVLPLLLDAFRLNLVGKYLTYSFVALGLVICWGFGGILSLGQGVFFGLGGYLMAMYLKLEASSVENTKIQSTPGIPDFMDWNQITALPWFWKPFQSLPFTLLAVLVVPALLRLRHRHGDVPPPRRRHLLRHHHPGHRRHPDDPHRRPAGLYRRHQRHHRPAHPARLGHPHRQRPQHPLLRQCGPARRLHPVRADA